MPEQNDKQPDEGKIVASLAKACHVPLDHMTQLYRHERDVLAQGARNTKFLHIFAIRNVLDLLRQPPC